MTRLNNMGKEDLMQKIVSLAKRRGFVYQGSEIYGGLAGVFDFGPRGVELLNNIKQSWWKSNVYDRENSFGLDSGMFRHPRTWEASGHIGGFSDPLAECKECNTRIRVDKELSNAGAVADEKMSIETINALFDEYREKISCPKCGKKNFSPVRSFNLLVKSNLGDFTSDGSEPVYLPGEACQGIYLDYKNIVDTMSPKLPFTVAQIGKAFRNEISPRNFLFRTREFEQADTQTFIRPNENKALYEEIKKNRLNWYTQDLGISPQKLRFKQHENLVFYASDAWDIEYEFPTGFDEVEGIHDRTDYDLTQHQNFSGVDLRYTDPENTEKYIPWVLETSMGVGRVFLAVMCDSYHEDEMDGETRVVLKLAHNLAPVKICVSPLLKNKPELVAKAKEIYSLIKKQVPQTAWDDNGNIGKRYRRQDEIGTPFCVVVDFDSLEDESITVRHRDTGSQERIKISNIEGYFREKFQ